MNDDTLPEADKLDDAPHPRNTDRLFGQEATEAAFLESFAAGRLPHGWLLTGPKGIGKATFAWRAARFLLATPSSSGDDGLFGAPPPPENLDIDPGHPVAARLKALSEPGLCLLRRPWDEKTKRLKTQLTVDEVRTLKSFFALTAGGNGHRVVIVDSADEMNANAANALLKALEEPPRDTTLLLVSHRPSGLLPTIRSRCRNLRFQPLHTQDLTQALIQAGHAPGDNSHGLTELSGGSVGKAVRLLSLGGLDLYADLLALVGSLPSLDRPLAIKLSDAVAGKQGEARFDLTLSLIDILLARLARSGVAGQAAPDIVPGEARLLSRLAPDTHAARRWADTAATLTARARRGKAVNLDPAALTFDMFLELDRVAARLPA